MLRYDNGAVLIKQCLDKFTCNKRPQVLDALAYPDKPDRKRLFIVALPRDSGDHSAFGGTIQFSDDEAGQAERIIEGFNLGNGVLPGIRVEHQQSFMRRT